LKRVPEPTRIAWAADNGLQCHGGSDFALRIPISRLLCDARILDSFEGAPKSRRRGSRGGYWRGAN
jgi:alkylation response protein AidB-like acyl-CoA dehydrogenase